MRANNNDLVIKVTLARQDRDMTLQECENLKAANQKFDRVGMRQGTVIDHLCDYASVLRARIEQLEGSNVAKVDHRTDASAKHGSSDSHPMSHFEFRDGKWRPKEAATKPGWKGG